MCTGDVVDLLDRHDVKSYPCADDSRGLYASCRRDDVDMPVTLLSRCVSVVHLPPSSTDGSHLVRIEKLRDHELSMVHKSPSPVVVILSAIMIRRDRLSTIGDHAFPMEQSVA